MRKGRIDKVLIKELAELLEETGLTEIEWSEGIRRVRVSRQSGGAVIAPATATVAAQAALSAPSAEAIKPATDPADHPGAVKSPMVGTAYLSAKPGQPAFIREGDKVTEGQTLLLVEAMKTYNPIRATKSGVISRILVHDSQPVEYGEVLVLVDEA